MPRDDIPEAMLEPLAMYVAEVYHVTPAPAVEQRLEIPAVHPECYGTADALHRAGTDVYVWDLKYGYQVVEVVDNWQLVCYAAGVARPGDTVHVVIVQPRVWHPAGRARVFSITYEQLAERVSRLRERALLAMSGQAYTAPGRHCSYCPALAVCPAARRVLLDHSEPAIAEPIPDHALAEELRLLRDLDQVLRMRVGALEADALQRMRSGKRLPGIHTRQTESRLQWTAAPEDVLRMASACGYQISRPVTPTQALDAGVPAEIINQYASRKPGAVQVSTGCDRKASEVFKHG